MERDIAIHPISKVHKVMRITLFYRLKNGKIFGGIPFAPPEMANTRKERSYEHENLNVHP